MEKEKNCSFLINLNVENQIKGIFTPELILKNNFKNGKNAGLYLNYQLRINVIFKLVNQKQKVKLILDKELNPQVIKRLAMFDPSKKK